MGIVIDIVAVLFVIISALFAYYKGFVKTFFGFISVILAFILASCFARPFGGILKDSTEIDEWIVDNVVNIGSFDDMNKNYTILSGENISGEIMVEDIVSGDEMASGEVIYPEELVNFFNSLPTSIGGFLNFEDKKHETLLNVATKLADGVINILSWIIIYFVVRIIFAVLIVVFNGIMSIPILKSINQLAGLGIGAILGIIRIYILLAIIYFVSYLFKITFLVNIIQNSGIVNAMYNHNLIISLFF